MGELEISWKHVPSRSHGYIDGNGRRTRACREDARRCRDADRRAKKVTANVHDTTKLPHTIFPMTFVRQTVSCSLSDASEEEKTSLTEDTTTNSFKNFVSTRAVENNSPVAAKKPKLDNFSLNEASGCSAVEDRNTAAALSLSIDNADCVEVVLSKIQKKKLEAFILHQRNEESAISILNSSADICKLSHECIFEQEWNEKGISRFTCSFYVNGVLVGKARADDKKTSKHAAATYALELLRHTQPTLLISSSPGDLDSALSRTDITSGSGNSVSKEKIADSNVGNQLLRKMGWKGEGGLGRSGSGISVPISVTETYGRAGLGIECKDANLISFKDAHDVIRNYAASQSTDELTFSPELTNEERAKIHKLSRRYGLRSKSYNKGEIRYLVVSRKISAAALVDQLKSSGGTKGSVQLIGPGQTKPGSL